LGSPAAHQAPAATRGPRRQPPARIEEASQVSLSVEDLASVRPFVVTGGRTKGSTDTRLESILEVANQQWLADKGKRLSPEEAAIVRQIATTYLTVAEVSAHLKLPVGVVKVLVSDLAEAGVLVVHDTMAGGGGVDAGGPVSREQTLELLESVLNAISKL
jgi:DNA-directed RNA polymerase specialized sigma24 family protein